MTTIFKRIIKGELPAEKVYESDKILVIKDKYPVAPVHLLILPKEEFTDLNQLQEKDKDLIFEIVSIAQKLAEQFGISDGYRFLTNCGAMAGQSVFHLHFHVIGGRELDCLA